MRWARSGEMSSHQGWTWCHLSWDSHFKIIMLAGNWGGQEQGKRHPTQDEPDASSRETVILRVLYWQVFEVGENKGGVIPPKMNLMPPHYDGIQCMALSGDTLFSGDNLFIMQSLFILFFFRVNISFRLCISLEPLERPKEIYNFPWYIYCSTFTSSQNECALCNLILCQNAVSRRVKKCLFWSSPAKMKAYLVPQPCFGLILRFPSLCLMSLPLCKENWS